MSNLSLTHPIPESCEHILNAEALDFLFALEKEFGGKRRELLQARVLRQREIDRGVMPDFLESTQSVRQADWKVSPVPEDLQDRRVEITGPVDRKMVINALNSGVRVFMADFEDSHSPTWTGTVEGQVNMFDAVRRTITFTNDAGKKYQLNEKVATLMVRPRGWHLEEKHAVVDGKAMSASLFDFGLFFFHNAKELLERGTGPYFYLPKLESHLEARLWNDVFLFAQSRLGIPKGTIKATVLIETILGAFEMDEILYELREHSAGLNCGRWDYIFSYIKKFHHHPEFVLPDRSVVTMSQPFLKAYSEWVIRTCHRRGAHAMGGMAAQIPIKGDDHANAKALEKVRLDKEREVSAGHDGTWVAHPGLVPVAMEAFSKMTGKNQVDRLREDVQVTAKDLLAVPEGEITEAGLRSNISIGLQYLEAWLRGSGCVPLYNLMEDAATAEISRAQVWQWVHQPKGKLNDGRNIDLPLFRQLLVEETALIRKEVGEENFSQRKFDLAARIFDDITADTHFAEFLTLEAYRYLE